MRRGAVALAVLGAAAVARPACAQGPDKSYLFFVASRVADQVALIRFGPRGAVVEHRTTTRLDPAVAADPRAISVAPDGRSYFVTIANDSGPGALLKVAIARDSARIAQPADTVRDRDPVGAQPVAAQLTPDGAFAWVTNAAPSGSHSPSYLSVVLVGPMAEVARIETCGAARGSRITMDGSRQYSTCLDDDVVVEVDTRTLKVSREFVLSPGHEHAVTGAAPAEHPAATCEPSWAEPAADGRTLYVACSRSNDVVVLDVATWTMTRRIAMGDGVEQLATTNDGTRLIGTNRRGQSVSVIDLAGDHEVARIATARHEPSAVVVSPDDRYAFVSIAGTGTEPGSVEVLDLRTLKSVASVAVGGRAGAIAFWKIEDPGRTPPAPP